jgi:hypothetical protein
MAKMKLNACIVIALFACCWGATANGGAFYDGNQLFSFCSPTPGDFCRAYITGAVDALLRPRPEGIDFCLTDKVIVNQLVDVVMNYLRAHPEKRHYAAASVVNSAMTEAFPCKTP